MSRAFCSPVEASAAGMFLLACVTTRSDKCGPSSVRPAAASRIAIVLQQRAVAILDFNRAVVGQQLLHPPLQCDLGLRKFPRVVARCFKSSRQALGRFGAAGSDGDRNLGRFVLDRVEPMGIAG